MKEEDKAYLKSFYGRDWCPLFGPVFYFVNPLFVDYPLFVEDPFGAIAAQCHDIIRQTRDFLGSYSKVCTPDSPDATSCPSIQEIKDCIVRPMLILQGDPDSLADSDNIKMMSGYDERQIDAARNICRHWVELRPKARKWCVNRINYYYSNKLYDETKPTRRLRDPFFFDDQVFALLAISACRHILSNLDADQDSLERDLLFAHHCLMTALRSNFKRGKKIVSAASHGLKGKTYGSMSQKGLSAETKKKRESKNSRNRIWRLKASIIRKKKHISYAAIARILKEEEKIKESLSTIIRVISDK